MRLRLDALSDDPRPAGSLKLSGEELYRIRVGNYRIIYGIDVDERAVSVISVRHRSRAYRGLP